jgi:hypothetical protein
MSTHIKCEHNKIAYYCTTCPGSGICEHGRRKNRCTDCGGVCICDHGNIRDRCKQCGGVSICEHGRRKDSCHDCGGSRFCEHDTQAYYCITCKGPGICEHQRRKYQCKDCEGTQICEHNKRKADCIQCGGSQICKHGISKRYCKDCDGSIFCIHKKNKYRCKECDGRSLCKSSWCEVRGIPKYNGYCLSCCIQTFPELEVMKNYKTKEIDTVGYIKEFFPDFTWVHDKKVRDGCSKLRPDLLCDFGSQIIIIEIDEYKHIDYDSSCEHKRLMGLSQDLQHRPIVFIRFNPDAYIDTTGKTITSCWGYDKKGIMRIKPSKKKEWEQRIHSLKETVEHWVDTQSEKTIHIVELFY